MNALSQGDATAHTKVHKKCCFQQSLSLFQYANFSNLAYRKKKKLCVLWIGTRLDFYSQVCVTLYSLSWLYFTL